MFLFSFLGVGGKINFKLQTTPVALHHQAVLQHLVQVAVQVPLKKLKWKRYCVIQKLSIRYVDMSVMYRLDRILLTAILAFSVLSHTSNSVAETAQELANRCASELGMVEGVKPFKCSDGVPVFNNSFGSGCTSPPRLIYKKFISDQTGLSGEGCTDAYQGGRTGRVFYENRDIEAVFNCRKDLRNVSLEDNKYTDIAMIIHNNRSGKTCFFQSHVTTKGMDGDMPSPKESDTDSRWASPEEYGGEFGCETCHNKGPFIVSRHIAHAFAELDLFGDDTSVAPYTVVGPDFEEWQFYKKTGPDQCASACHFLQDLDSDPILLDTNTWLAINDDAKSLMPPSGLSPYNVNRLPIAASFGSETNWQSSRSDGWIRGKASNISGLRPAEESGNGHNYLYFNKGNAQGEATLTSKAFIARANSKFSFDYHMVGEGGQLSIEIFGRKSDEQEPKYYTVWRRAGSQQNNVADAWKRVVVHLSCYTGITQVRLKVTDGNSELGTIAMDNLHIYGNEIDEPLRLTELRRKDIYGDYQAIAANLDNAEHICNEEGYLRLKDVSAQCVDNVSKVVNYKNGIWESEDVNDKACADLYKDIECGFH